MQHKITCTFGLLTATWRTQFLVAGLICRENLKPEGWAPVFQFDHELGGGSDEPGVTVTYGGQHYMEL